MRLLVMSLGGALMICVIFLARLLLQNRTHRGVWLLLWGLVLVRLLVPLVPEAPSSIFNLPLFRQPQAAVTETVQLPLHPVATMPVTEAPKTAPTLTMANILVFVWAAVAVGVLLYFVISHLLATRKYRFAIPVDVPDVPARVRVKELEALTSPLTYGLIRPVILLPAGASKNEEDCRRVLAHELAHIRHGDVLYKWLLLIAASVHWFNPLVWVMMHTASQDMEMRADAAAVKALGETENYARMLIRAEEQKLKGYLVAGFSVSGTGARLRAMLKGKANRVLSVCMTVLLSAVLLCVCCTGQMPLAAKAAPSPAPQQLDTALPTEETEVPEMTEVPTEAQPAETEIAPTVEPTEAPAETPIEPAAAEAPAKPTEAPAPTEPQPTESAPTEPVPTEAPTQPTEPALTELPQPTEPASQALPTPEPTNQLPTSYSIASPGSITLHVGETRYYSLQSISILSFSCSGDLYVDALTVGPYDSFTEIRNYSVMITARQAGTYQIYCTNRNGITMHWATVTVLP